MDKFKDKYRIASHRKPNWDYSADAFYFLTIVTQNRECNLGKILNTNGSAVCQLSDFGEIVKDEWFKSFEIGNELILHEFILMPNHLHTIVEIYNPNRHEETHGHVETHGRVSLPIKPNDPESLSIKRNPPLRLPKSISSFIAGFKSAVNSKIDDHIDEYQLPMPKYNRSNHFFQPNYHDHIIRNDYEYQHISNYIINNPKNWGNDKFFI